MSSNMNVTIDVRREAWSGNDLMEVDVISFDGTDILGSLENDELPAPTDFDDSGDYCHCDFLFEEAIDAGLTEKYDGPYTVLESIDYDDYYAARMDGTVAPDREACKRRLTEMKLSNHKRELDELKQRIADLESQIEAEEEALR